MSEVLAFEAQFERAVMQAVASNGGELNRTRDLRRGIAKVRGGRGARGPFYERHWSRL
jgi:hypothetical protein